MNQSRCNTQFRSDLTVIQLKRKMFAWDALTITVFNAIAMHQPEKQRKVQKNEEEDRHNDARTKFNAVARDSGE